LGGDNKYGLEKKLILKELTRYKSVCIIQKYKEIQKYLIQTEGGAQNEEYKSNVFISTGVANILGMSESYAYTVIGKMNDELKTRGCFTIVARFQPSILKRSFSESRL